MYKCTKNAVPTKATDLLEAIHRNVINTYLALISHLMELFVINIPLEMSFQVGGEG